MVKFVHPGTMMSPSMTFSLNKDKTTDPIRKKAFDKLSKETVLKYKPMTLEIVDIGFHGVGAGHTECTKDGEMAYMGALMYWCTLDDKYANITINILNSWATKNKVFKGDNAPLEAAWSVCAMARSAARLNRRIHRLIVYFECLK